MTAIAWAITFIGLVHYERYLPTDASQGAKDMVGWITVVSLIMLVSATIREWIR
jgi:hypothetical protein